jgi:hypothetical protein
MKIRVLIASIFLLTAMVPVAMAIGGGWSGYVYVNVTGLSLYNPPDGTIVTGYINDSSLAWSVETSTPTVPGNQSGYFVWVIANISGYDLNVGDNVTFQVAGFPTNFTNMSWTAGWVYNSTQMIVSCGPVPCIGKASNETISTNATVNISTYKFLFTEMTIATGNTTSSGTFAVQEYIFNASKGNEAPPGVNNLTSQYGMGSKQNYLGRYVSIKIADALNSNISWVVMRTYYTDADLDLNGNGVIGDYGDLDEDTLSFWWYDNSTGTWKKITTGANYSSLGGPYVYGTARNASNVTYNGINYSGYIEANLSHFSVYGIGGDILSPPPSGGGGGGVYKPVVKIEPGVKVITGDDLFDFIYENRLQTRNFYVADQVLAPVYTSVGHFVISADLVEKVRKALFIQPRTLTGDIYELAASRVSYMRKNTVVIARGDIPVDGFVAVRLADALGAPVLLTEPGELPQSTLEAVKRIGASKVIIIGGPQAVSEGVEAALKEIAEVERIWGDDRYETAVKVAEAAMEKEDIGTVVITDGDQPDIIAPMVSKIYKAPIVYVRGDDIPEATKTFLGNNTFISAYYIGVSDQARSQLDDIFSYMP